MAPTDNQATEPSNDGLQLMGGRGLSGRGTKVAGLAVVAFLFAVSVGLVIQGGAFGPSTWLPLMVAVAALALPVTIAGPLVSSSRFQKMLLAVFALQAVWTAASLIWANSLANAWEETNRTLLYVITLSLVFTAVRWAGTAALKAIAAAVLAIAGGVAVAAIVALLVTTDPLSLFVAGRLNYPIAYFNGLAALLMVGFWLALGIAGGVRRVRMADCADPQSGDSQSETVATVSRVAWRRSQVVRPESDRFPLWTQPLCLVLATVFLEVALLTQSRAALWAFFLVIPLFMILSPHRFRSLTSLVVVLAPVVLFWGRLNAPYVAIKGSTSLSAALDENLLAIGYSVAIVLGAWLLTWLVERWIGPLRRKAIVWIGVVVAAVAILGAAGGIVFADVRTGGLDEYLTDRWQELTGDGQADANGGTRFVGVGLNGRVRMWMVAAEAFTDQPVLGIGAQNYEAYWYQHRTLPATVRQPHSQPMQLLAELGIPGITLWLLFVIAALVYAGTVRFRASSWAVRVMIAASMTAALSWFLHSSADWLWQLAGVSLPAIMLLGALVGASKGAAASAGAAIQRSAKSPSTTESMTTADSPEISGAPTVPDSATPARGRRTRHLRHSRRSPLARGLVVLLVLIAMASAALPYLSLRYSALASGAPDLDQMAARAQTAATLDPTSIEPYAARAGVHLATATSTSNASERLTQLRLAAAAWLEALKIEPGSWVCHLQAAQTLHAASRAALVIDRDLAQELEEQARTHLEEALRLNPLSPEIQALGGVSAWSW